MVAFWQRPCPLLIVPYVQMFVYVFCALIQLRLVQQQVLLTMLLVLQMVRHGQQPYQLLVQTMFCPYGDEQAARPASLTVMLCLRPDSKNSDPVTTTLSVAASADAAEPAPSG